ncbi:phosphonoacetate hydrolase [Microvirga brassicacearum]|uniref:Phosphonoacetate hydrolase n=2 Tax=Microvirga brassicacearum TaxID=2580413 RepID=A0A5N3PE92_9HYPH|nr:phosphonoacetate hydrolase [Microvirga brassicacearum]
MPLLVNGRSYSWPSLPVVVICFDGCDPSYLEAAEAAGVIPTLSSLMRHGYFGTALAAMPTFTNPNNISIVCGAAPSVHGIAGNYYLDRATGREVMMLDGERMRADTILARFSAAGAKVAIVTAKDKLLKSLARGFSGTACSAESAAQAINLIGSIPLPDSQEPDKYSADLSLFVLDAGIALLDRDRSDILYLSLSDYIQHKHAPEEPEALAFMRAVDDRIATLLAKGAVIGIVADHGMNDMALPDGAANVVFLEDLIEQEFGKGTARVICPITDPFVRHHASLGGFVRVYLKRADVSRDSVAALLASVLGVQSVLSAAEACKLYELPGEGEGDLVVVAERGVALGARAEEHDLSALAGTRLRSHGGTSEQKVPFILSHPLKPDYAGRARKGLRNFDIFDYALNGVKL